MLRLTDKQIEAVSLVARHMTSKEIARQLDISHHAIDQRIKSACLRLGTTNRRDAARAYLEYLRHESPRDLDRIADHSSALAMRR